jgi:hypothetical protein
MKILSGPSHVIVEASKQAIAAAAAIEDPIDRERALKRAAECIPELQNQLRLARAAAIREAVETRSATSVAAEMGISRSRLYKVLEGADRDAG